MAVQHKLILHLVELAFEVRQGEHKPNTGKKSVPDPQMLMMGA